jgi:threonine/homoserine/homoserine lactone efflux protein
VNSARILAFCASFFVIAMSPGLCMTMAMSLGISVGLRRALWWMLGELVGVTLVASAAMLGVAALLLGAPLMFTAFKFVGAAYLLWMAWRTWHSPVGGLAATSRVTPLELCMQGFMTAISNPKAWAFMMALLPPFIDPRAPLAPQMALLLSLMIVIEFSALLIYAWGGRGLSELLLRRGQAQWLNRIAALLMVVVAGWLVLG